MSTKNDSILVLNCGSSSVKFALIELQNQQQIISGLAENLTTKTAKIGWKEHDQKSAAELTDGSHAGALAKIGEIIQPCLKTTHLIGIGHRVVHGGEHFTNSTIITAEVLATIKDCAKIAPLHNPANIAGIESASELFPALPQVAVFDTAFHQTMPAHIYSYALPYEWYQQHKLRRYGFHGTSHRYVTKRCSEILGRPLQELALLSAHLGNGCSACAVLNGSSVDTTMGFTPLEGLMMGTRCGDIDPSIAEFICDQEKLDIKAVTNIFNKKSGLLGVSGLSNDMRELLAAKDSGNARAKLAIDIFCYRLAKHLAGLMVSLGKVDALIFTGGVGENAAAIRAQVLEHLKFYNFAVDQVANAENGKNNNGKITTANSVVAFVVPTNEELMIALDTAAIIK